MPERGADLMERLIDAFEEEGVEAALAFAHPEIIWRAPPEWLEDREYVGHDELRRLVSFWSGQFDDYRLEKVRVIPLDDGRIVGLVHQRGRIKESGTEVEQEVGYLATVRDDLIAEVDVYFSWAATFDAAGIEPPDGPG